MNHVPRSSAQAMGPGQGFVRYDLFIAVAMLCLALAVIIPQSQKHGLKGALLALLLMGGLLAAVVGVLVAFGWLIELAGSPVSGWRGKAIRGAGHALRFGLFGLIASALGAGLCVFHGLARATEDFIILGAGLLGGGSACLLHHFLGPARFWPAFRRFCLALLGSFLGGILGILGPGNWGVTIGILVPLLLFTLLAALGRMAPPPAGAAPPGR